MYQVEFFEYDNGECDIGDWLDRLKAEAKKRKDAQVQLKQVSYAIDRLQLYGTRNPKDIVKHLQDDIWELRPGSNRVLLFHYRDGKFVLLHHFRKTTQKTPPSEITQAKEEQKIYLRQQGGTST